MIPAGLSADDGDATFALIRLAAGRDLFRATLRAVDVQGETVIVEVVKDESGVDVNAIIERHLAEDALTGLPGRELLLDRLVTTLGATRRSANLVGVLWVDLDRFRRVNAEHGTPAADEALSDVGRCLSAALRPGDSLARMGGDEFVVIGAEIESTAGALALGERLRRAVAAATSASDVSVELTASIGIVVGGPDDNAAELLAGAETACIAAKANGRNRCELYGDELRTIVERNQVADREVRASLEAGRLALQYEPIVALASGEVVLLSVTAQMPGVDDVLALTATASLTQRIVLSVIDQAATELMSVDALGGAGLVVPVPQDVLTGDEVGRRILETVAGRGLAPDRLVLSLTERSLSEHRPAVTQTMEMLDRRGVRFALSGFAGGAVGRERIRESRFSLVELDPLLLAELAGAPADRVLAGPAAQAVGGHNRQIVAVGVDTAASLTDARIAGCHLARGRAVGVLVADLSNLAASQRA